MGLAGSGHFPGTLFHDKIARVFHRKLASFPNARISKELARVWEGPEAGRLTGLQATLEKHLLDPFLNRHSSNLSMEQILALGRGVEAWARWLTDFLQKSLGRGKGADPRLSDAFCDPEEKIRDTVRLSGGREVEIVGVFDTVLMDLANGEAVVVEYKGRRPAGLDEDFIQAALYAWLLNRTAGITPRAVVLYLEDDRLEASYSAEDIREAQGNLLELVESMPEIRTAVKKGRSALPSPNDGGLCRICPFDRNCDSDWGRRAGRMESAPEASEDGALMDKLVSTLNVLKLPVSSAGAIVGPRLIRLKVRPDLERGTTVKRIVNRAQDIQIALSLKSAPLIRAGAGHVSVDVPRKATAPLTLSELWEKGQVNRPRSPAAFPLGMAVDGAVQWADLTDPTMTSILVAGTAGSGKSIFLRSAVTALALNAGPDRVRVTLIDPKRVSFTDLDGLPHLAEPAIMDIEPALEVLTGLVDEMEQRYRLMSDQGAADLADLNQKGAGLAHHVVIVDEYADLMIETEYRKIIEAGIQRLGQKGRAAGLHLLLSTQRPDSKIITPLIKANLQLKVALKVTTATNSQVILDEPGAERLMGHGDMLIGGAVPLTRLQGAIPTKTEIEAARKGGF